MRWLGLCAMLCSSAGCTKGLQNVDIYLDLRLLGMVAEPPAVLSDAPAPLATQFSALLVDPRGGPVTYTWTFCPIQSSQVCDDFDAQMQLLDPNDQAMLRGLHGLSQSGTANPTADVHGVTSYAIPPFDLQATATTAGVSLLPLYIYYAKANLFGEGLGVWPSAVLTVQSTHGDSVVGEKRVVYGIESFAAAAAALGQRFGIPICPTSGAPPAGCLQLPTFTPNNNPNFAQILTTPGGLVVANANAYTPVTGPIRVPAKQSIQLRPTFTAGSAETYETLRGSLQNREVQVETLTEALSVSWFCSGGTLAHNLTWPLFTKDLDNTFTAPATPPSANNGAIDCWLVGRDQRGGEVVQSVQLQITTP